MHLSSVLFWRKQVPRWLPFTPNAPFGARCFLTSPVSLRTGSIQVLMRLGARWTIGVGYVLITFEPFDILSFEKCQPHVLMHLMARGAF